MSEIVKVKVSSDWTNSERNEVVNLIEAESERLLAECQHIQQKGDRLSSHMAFEKSTKERRHLSRLKWFVLSANAIALEATRSDYSQFIE